MYYFFILFSWLLLFNLMFVGFINVVCCDFVHLNYCVIFHCVNIPQFTCSNSLTQLSHS